jgi:5-methylcytosine-specific restriction endonuclease McrA
MLLSEIDPSKEYKMTEIAEYIFARDDGLCQNPQCGEVGTEIHHILYRSHGGKNKTDNLILLCAKCHRGINGIHKSDFKERKKMKKIFEERIKKNHSKLKENLC